MYTSSMRTFVTSFGPLFCAALLVCFTEALCYFLIKQSPFRPLNQLLYFSYDQPRQEWNFVVASKLARYLGLPFTYIVTGDSTGLFGVDPLTIQQHLKGHSVLNANCCALLGSDGYYLVAKVFAEYNKAAETLVLSATLLPFHSISTRSLIHSIQNYDTISSSWMWLPSMAARPALAGLLFYGKPLQETMQRHFFGTLSDKLIRVNNNGWVPLTPIFEAVERPACLEPAAGDDSILRAIKSTYDLAQQCNLRMVVMFNPLNCTPGPSLLALAAEVEGFLRKNPSIASPLPIIRVYDASYFADRIHLNIQGALKNSHEMGMAMMMMDRSVSRGSRPDTYKQLKGNRCATH